MTIDLNPYFRNDLDDASIRAWCTERGILTEALERDPSIEGSMRVNRFRLDGEGEFTYAIVLHLYGYELPADNGLILFVLEDVPDNQPNRIAAEEIMLHLDRQVIEQYDGVNVPTPEEFDAMWGVN